MQNIAFRNQTRLSDWIFDLSTAKGDEELGKMGRLPLYVAIVPVSLAAEAKQSDADIIVVGLQEIVDLNASNLMKTR
jgi:hypothetical protein